MKLLYLLPILFLFSLHTTAQNNNGYWHGKERSIHYQPQGEDFVCTNGTHRFNRTLYGTNTAFRVEAGDLPEFAMYLPGMGGNLKFGLIAGNQSKQMVARKPIIVGNELNTTINNQDGNKTLFVRLKQGHFTWWQPICFTVLQPSNNITKKEPKGSYEKVNLAPYFNDKVTHIFTNKYLSPRPTSTTLQLPTQGIGNWCYLLTMATIDDTGLRKLAGSKDEITLPNGVPFTTPNDSNKNNILFTSQWDNYPNEKTITLADCFIN